MNNLLTSSDISHHCIITSDLGTAEPAWTHSSDIPVLIIRHSIKTGCAEIILANKKKITIT